MASKIDVAKRVYALIPLMIENVDELKDTPLNVQQIKAVSNRLQTLLDRKIKEVHPYLYQDEQDMVQFNRIAEFASMFATILDSTTTPDQFEELQTLLINYAKRYQIKLDN